MTPFEASAREVIVQLMFSPQLCKLIPVRAESVTRPDFRLICGRALHSTIASMQIRSTFSKLEVMTSLRQ